MKKTALLCAGLAATLALSGCTTAAKPAGSRCHVEKRIEYRYEGSSINPNTPSGLARVPVGSYTTEREVCD